MSKFVDIVLDKLNEYGINVYDQHMSEKDSYVIMSDTFTLFVDIKNKVLSISFHAATKPEFVANNTLIIKEIEEVKRIDIMESFAYDENRKVLCGEEAFKVVEGQVVENIMQQQTFMNILMKEDCYKC